MIIFEPTMIPKETFKLNLKKTNEITKAAIPIATLMA
jgi:hypothetical protein